ncbi:MAG: hypothetical protein R2713_16165 [Ilumatobacteraceae bacterium]
MTSRAAYGRLLDGGLNVDEWKWVPGPATEIWMDNYCIPTGARTPRPPMPGSTGCSRPRCRSRTSALHGYHSGMKNIDQLIAELAPDLTYPEIIFFTDEQVATMQTGAVNSAQDRLVEIYDKVKAKAAG